MRVRTCRRSERNSSSSWRSASFSDDAEASCDSSSAFSSCRLFTSSTARVIRSSRCDKESNSFCGCAAFIQNSLSLGAGCLSLLDKGSKSGFITRRQISQNLAIQFDTGFLQAAHKSAVGDVGSAARRANAHDPQRPEIALLAAPSHIAIAQRLFDGLLRSAVQLALGKKKTRRSLERLVAVGPSFGSSFNS